MANDIDFVNVPFAVDAASMADRAVDQLRGQWADWEPDDGDPEVIVLEALAPMAADAASVAAAVPIEVVATMGTRLYGIPYVGGLSAIGLVTFLVIDAAGYTIPAGREIEIDNFAFRLLDDAVVPIGSTSIEHCLVACTKIGADANNLTGTTVTSLNLPIFVTANPVLEAPTTGGRDPMDIQTYVNEVSRKMRLRAETVVTTRDFEIEALNLAEVGRAHADGNTARVVTITLATIDGLPVSTATKDAYIAYLDQFALVNTDYVVQDASYAQIDVDFAVVADAGQDKAALKDAIIAMLANRLNAAAYGQSQASSPNTTWVNDPVVRHNAVLVAIGTVQGVRLVNSVTLSSPTPGTSVDPVTGDLTMPGTVALPTFGTYTGTVS